MLTCLRDPFAVYDSARAPAVQDLVAKYDQPARTPAVQEVEGDGAEPRVRLGDIGGPVVEDPAAPRSTTPAARGMAHAERHSIMSFVTLLVLPWHLTRFLFVAEGEDIGTTPVVQQFETMSLSDDPAHVGAGKKGAKAEEWKDKPRTRWAARPVALATRTG